MIETAELSKQIEKYFNVVSERQFVENLRRENIDENQIRLYVKEQVLKFLLEYAAGVKKTHITYELDDQGNVIYPGIGPAMKMEEMLKQAVVKSSGGLREREELLGWQKMQALFSKSGANQVLQLSPPDRSNISHGNYGFLFWFEKTGPKQIVNHILRYEENINSLTESKQLSQALQGVGLTEPQGYTAEGEAVKQHLKELGLSFDNRSYLFEQALLKDPEFLYLFAKYETDLLKRNFFQRDCEQMLSSLYNFAADKAASLGLLERPAVRMARPLIFAGGSCPVIDFGNSLYNYASYLYGEPFTCPNCGYVSYTPVGNRCPNCRITKQEWRKKQKQKKRAILI